MSDVAHWSHYELVHNPRVGASCYKRVFQRYDHTVRIMHDNRQLNRQRNLSQTPNMKTNFGVRVIKPIISLSAGGKQDSYIDTMTFTAWKDGPPVHISSLTTKVI
jgi:hypothetical protein